MIIDNMMPVTEHLIDANMIYQSHVYILIGGFNPYENNDSHLIPIYGQIKHVPNHQPVYIYIYSFTGDMIYIYIYMYIYIMIIYGARAAK